MNTKVAKGRWQQLMGSLIAGWGHAQGDALIVMTGRHQELVGRLNAACAGAIEEMGCQMDAVHRRSRALGKGSGPSVAPLSVL